MSGRSWPTTTYLDRGEASRAEASRCEAMGAIEGVPRTDEAAELTALST
jgi:hypothetical protein